MSNAGGKRSLYYHQIVDLNWWFGSNEDGGYSNEAISTAALLDIASSARRSAAALESILSQIRSLGNDGIHAAIKHVAKKARRAEK